MEPQQSDDIMALELVKKSVLHKNMVICQLQQEVETWKKKFYSKDIEVLRLTKQLNEQGLYSDRSSITNDLATTISETSPGTSFVATPNTYAVEIKEEDNNDDEWHEDETESCIVGRCSEGLGDDSIWFAKNFKKSRIQLNVNAPEDTSEFLPSLNEFPERSGSNNASVDDTFSGPDLQQASEDRIQRGWSSEAGDNIHWTRSSDVGHRPSRKDPQVEGPVQHIHPKSGNSLACSSDFDAHLTTHTGTNLQGPCRTNSEAEMAPFACTAEGCAYRCAQLPVLKRHVRTHALEKFSCTVEGCGYRTLHVSNLARHSRTHTGEKPFSCEVEGCTYRTADASNLQRHFRTHIG